ncbi:prefoldin subunit 6 [Onthophagus taurus]|uniref:prefoldin subunit 6 n=1 Tax=Onthophagus taurus TaxID=166361 RepID=UPI000C20500F|nr:prefoldin subunit 6 [Onthophagus taurus]
MAEDLQRKMQAELETYQTLQKEYRKALTVRQQLETQLTENNMVSDELKMLKDDTAIFKSVGPILVKTELVEAKQNVLKRIEYISKEMKRVEEQIAGIEKKQDTSRETLQKFQQQIQQAQMRAAMQA